MCHSKAGFEDKLCILPHLAEILDKDFEGSKGLRQIMLHECPKFGNDDDRGDSLMRELTSLFSDTAGEYTNPRGGSFQMGLYTVDHHAHMGARTAALPDGRKGQTSLANGFSPVQGADINGSTGLIKSITKNDLWKLGNGMAQD